jgi:hypothetical protein
MDDFRTFRGATYTTVSTVCTSSLLWCLVDLNVLDDQVAGVESLSVGVCLCVLEKTKEKLGGLDGPTGTRDTKCLAYIPITSSAFALPSDTSYFPMINATYPAQRDQFHQHIVALAQLPCAPGRSRGTSRHAPTSSH